MEKLIVFVDPTNPVTESYRTLCAAVLAGQNGSKVIGMTGVAENNASLVTANLAVAMAQMGKTVLLIDCNLRNPKQYELFALQNIGLANCITGSESYKTFVQATQQPNLFVLMAGSRVANPVELLSSSVMQSILQETKETYDVVLLDLPPTGYVSDAVVLGAKTDGVVLVLMKKQDKVEHALKAKELFIQAGVSILGCVLDRA